jgi:hypothetical protein
MTCALAGLSGHGLDTKNANVRLESRAMRWKEPPNLRVMKSSRSRARFNDEPPVTITRALLKERAS